MSKNKYALVIVDNYSKYMWVLFLHFKNEETEMIIDHIKKIELGADLSMRTIRPDIGTKFRNADFK